MTVDDARTIICNAGYSPVQTGDRPNIIQIFETGGLQPIGEVRTDGEFADDSDLTNFLMSRKGR